LATIRNTLETNFTTRGATRAVRETEQIGRAQTRLGQSSASAGRSFSSQSQGLGGLVGIYAAAAANVFAISAAFEALNAAAKFDTIIRGTESLANAVGTSATQVISSLKNITEGQLSIVEAARNANLALSAGFNVEQIEKLGAVALKASRALGRDLGDSFQRLARGAIKLEPELLDELGIFTRIEPAVEAYARQVGKSVSQLTQFERRQAFANQVIKDGTEAFRDIDTSVISTQEKFERLVANFTDLALIVGSFLADRLAPLAEFLDKNLGNRIILLGSIGLLVFNSLKTVVAGFAMQGIATLSTSLAGLSQSFESTRASAADFGNEAGAVNSQLQGQGAFVGGNASQGAAFKRTLAEGTMSSRRAVELDAQLPQFRTAELRYQDQLQERRQRGTLTTQTMNRLLRQSQQRVIGIDAGMQLVEARLRGATILTRVWGTTLNVAARAVSAIGKGLGKVFGLLNAVVILFTGAQIIASFFGIDLIEKATDLYNKFFQASQENAAGQKTFSAAMENSTGFISKQADEMERLNAAREANNMAPITSQQLSKANVQEDIIDPRREELLKLRRMDMMPVGPNPEQSAITADIGSGPVSKTEAIQKRIRENIMADEKSIHLTKKSNREVIAALSEKELELESRLTALQTDRNNRQTVATISTASADTARINAEMELESIRDKQPGYFTRASKFTESEAAAYAQKLALQERIVMFEEEAIADRQKVGALDLAIQAAQGAITDFAKTRVNAMRDIGVIEEGLVEKNKELLALAEKSDTIGRLEEARLKRIKEILAEIKDERAAIAAAQQLTAMENLQGQIQGQLGTEDKSLVKLVNLGQAKKEGDQLILIFRGIQAEVAKVFNDPTSDMFGKLVDKDQLEGLNASTQTIDKLQKLMTGLTGGTTSASRAAKDMVVVFDLLGKAFESGVLDKNSQLGKAIATSVSEADGLNIEFQRMNALNNKLAKTFQKSFSFLEDMYLNGKVSAETGQIAKNAEEELTFQRANLAALKQKRADLDATVTIREEELRNASAIAVIDEILLKTSKEAFAQQIKRVPLVEKEAKAQDKLLAAAYEQLRVQEAKNREANRSLDIAKKQADIESMTQRGAFIQRRAGAKNPFKNIELQGVQDNARIGFKGPTIQASFNAPRGGAADEGALNSNQIDRLDQAPIPTAARAAVQQSLARDYGGAETFGKDAKAVNLLQLRLNGAAVAMENATDSKRRYKSVVILGTDDIERLKSFNAVMGVNAEKTELAASQLRELNAVGRQGAAIERQGVMIDAEASAAGAQAASAARVAKAERETAKILDRTILKREDILKVELALEKTKMEEAKRSAGAQAGVARLKAKQDKAALDDQRAARKDEQADILAELKQRKDLFNQQETVRQAEFEIMNLGKLFEQDILRQQKENIDLKRKDDLAAVSAQIVDRQAQNTLQRDKAALLLTQITHDKKVIADNRDLLIANGNEKAKELTLRTTSKLDDPSQGLMDNVKDILENYDTISDLITQAGVTQTEGIKAAAKGEKDLLQKRIENLGLLIAKNGDLEIQQRLVAKVQNDIMDMELNHAEQMMIADMANFDLKEKNIEKNLRKTLAGMGAEGAAAERLFKDKLEQLAYELSARKKLKELILGITNDINGGLANAIQKVFENISTRGASLTDGIKEIGLGMYEDIRKTIVSQTIVTPAQDMMKGFIGNLTGFDLDKKGIDDVELVGKKVPVTLDGAEEGPITKVKREMEEKGESFFTGFKEKAKGAFETIQSSLGEFGSKAMETFRGLGSSLKDLFTGEGGIMKSLSGFMQGITGNGGEGVGSTLFNLGKTALSFFGPAAAATGGLVGMTGVRNMAAGGQVNALRDRVPAMLEPGEFVIRKPAAKSIGNRALGQMNATGAAGMGNVQFNIVNEGAPKSAEQQGPPKFDADKIVVEVVMRDLQSNGPIRNAMRNG